MQQTSSSARRYLCHFISTPMRNIGYRPKDHFELFADVSKSKSFQLPVLPPLEVIEPPKKMEAPAPNVPTIVSRPIEARKTMSFDHMNTNQDSSAYRPVDTLFFNQVQALQNRIGDSEKSQLKFVEEMGRLQTSFHESFRQQEYSMRDESHMARYVSLILFLAPKTAHSPLSQ